MNNNVHGFIVRVVSDWAVKIGGVSLEALGPFGSMLDTGLSLDFSFDGIAVNITVDVHTHIKLVCIVVSNSLLSGSCDSIVMLIDAEDIKHMVSGTHYLIDIIVSQLLIENSLGIELVRSIVVVGCSSNVLLVVGSR